ncbi:MAG: DUF1460 domain-containing protein [Ignavibacteriales bacterium]|nr:DUF1460 domain-containing protein [Ignavibacteriales bacterium]
MKPKSLKNLLLLLTFSISMMSLTAQAEKKIYNMTNFEIDDLLTSVSQMDMTITERISYFSEMFLGMPYNLTCTGDGPYALYEPEPLVNFDETNCMVFCEHVLALSISDNWDNFFNNLQQIRYQDGIIGMRTRNHYTMGDWITENNWLLDDVTSVVGGDVSKSTKRTISHEKFFTGKGIDDLRYVKPDREITINYIPFKKLSTVKSNIKNGDIGSLIFANKTDIFSAHMFMMIIQDNELYVRESSSSKMITFDTKFDEWLLKYLNSEKYCGITLMRVKEELNTKGKIILPWEIHNLKK